MLTVIAIAAAILWFSLYFEPADWESSFWGNVFKYRRVVR